MNAFIQDVRYAARMLRKSLSFTAIAVLTIALGIGATTAIFSLVDATLLHPLPYPQPEQLVRVEDDLPGVGAQDVGMSVPEWHDLQRSGIFEYVSLAVYGPVNLRAPLSLLEPATPVSRRIILRCWALSHSWGARLIPRIRRPDLPLKFSSVTDYGRGLSRPIRGFWAKVCGLTMTCIP